MKLLIFAHSPPPHHGQSYMVKLMVDGLGGDRRHGTSAAASTKEIECYHVNCRYSDDLADIGSFRFEKMWLVVRYCLEAIWCRFRYGIHAFYYVPAPGKRSALYRDWVVMSLCRPFFSRLICHWHAVGLGDWLKNHASFAERWITHRLLGRPALGITLGALSMRDALWFRSQSVEIVPNGIPDPCPNFEEEIRPRREARMKARRRLLAGEALSESERAAAGGDPEVFKILYLAHCTREKGLFDAVDGVALLNAKLLAAGSPIRCRVFVAGAFLDPKEEVEFRERLAQPDISDAAQYVGFVDSTEKDAHFRGSDCFCFPTYYAAEGQPVSLVESIAYGLPIVTTAWRSIPDILPPDFDGFVPVRSPKEIADTLLKVAQEGAVGFREHFLRRYVSDRYVQLLREAICASGAS